MEWRSIPEYEGIYDISEMGEVRRIAGYSDGRKIPYGRPVKSRRHSVGYRSITLSKDGITRRFLVHRLVAPAFFGPIPAGKEINHRDGDKTNNHISNLEYMTHSENHFHRYRVLGQKSYGSKKFIGVVHPAYSR